MRKCTALRNFSLPRYHSTLRYISNTAIKTMLKLEKVLILDSVDTVCENILKDAGIQVTTRAKLSIDELIGEINRHDGLIVRSATKVSADILEHTKRLKVVGRAGTGVDNIDVAAATRKGVLVMNTPGGNTLSAAEHTCSLICSLSRAIPQACATLKEGSWNRKQFMGNELYGKVLAIVGLGRIGKEVSDRMKSFGMKVIGYDPIVSPETAASWGIDYYPLQEIWPKADYITVHVPLIPQTHHMINESILKICKPSVKIVNVARGGIVDEKALLKGLEEGTCGGAALDVFEQEPPTDLSLIRHPKVICTPHLGANTHEAQKRVAVEIAEQFVAMSRGNPLIGVINAPALAESGSPVARPWIQLAISLGTLASELTQLQSNAKLTVRLQGDSCRFSNLMSPSVLKGFLSGSHSKANLVNASLLAKEANVEISVTNLQAEEEVESVPSRIEIFIEKTSGNFSLIGFTSGLKPLLGCINNCKFSSGLALEDNLLFFTTSSTTTKGISLVAAALQNAPLIALISSSPSDKETFVVARTLGNVGNVPEVNATRFIAQVHF